MATSWDQDWHVAGYSAEKMAYSHDGEEWWKAQWHCGFCSNWTWSTMQRCSNCYRDRSVCEGPIDGTRPLRFGNGQLADTSASGQEENASLEDSDVVLPEVFAEQSDVSTEIEPAEQHTPQSVDWLELGISEKRSSFSIKRYLPACPPDTMLTGPPSASRWLGSEAPRWRASAAGHHPSVHKAEIVLNEKVQEFGIPIRNDSELHRNGACKPCKYFSRRDGCELGDQCNFCHFPHPRGHPGTQWRPSKEKRLAFQRAVAQGNAEVPGWIANNPFLARKLEQAQIKTAQSQTIPPGVVHLM